MIKSNELNKKIIIQEEVKNSDGVGGFDSEWRDLKSIWAKVEFANTQLKNEYDGLSIKSDCVMTARKLNNINDKMRIIFNDKIYNIKYIDNTDKNFIKIFCLNF